MHTEIQSYLETHEALRDTGNESGIPILFMWYPNAGTFWFTGHYCQIVQGDNVVVADRPRLFINYEEPSGAVEFKVTVDATITARIEADVTIEQKPDVNPTVSVKTELA